MILSNSLSNIYIHLTFSNVPSHLLGRRHGSLQLIINMYIHLTFPNVPSHLLGRIHGPLHLITFHIPQCTLTFTWEKT